MRVLRGSEATEGATPVVAVRRLTSEEAALQEVWIHPDLTALEELSGEERFVLDGGGEATLDHDVEPCALVGPRGWLGAGVAGGDVVVVRWDGASLHVTCGPEEPAYDEVAAARLERLLVATFEADQLEPFDDESERDEDEGEDIEFSGVADVVVLIDEEHPGVFATLVPPLSELVVAAGLELDATGERVGRPGTDWETLARVADVIEELTERRARHVRSRDAFAAVDVLLDAFDDGVDAGEARALAGLFAVEPGVAPAVAEEIVTHGDSLGAADAFARALLEAARGGTAAAGAAWLLGAVAEELGDREAQERWLHRSLAADRSYAPALVDSSWYASDRGDASRAASLLAAVGVGDEDSWYRRLSGSAVAGPLAAGRNDPCPCGSGRKHKACCARTNGWPLTARAAWLYDKAAAYLDRPYAQAALAELYDLEMDEYYRMDLALFEGGVLEEFVEARGPLLPVDERELAGSWIGRRRRVYEVIELRPGEGLTVEDAGNGEVTTLVERSGSRTLQLHQLVNLRLLPAGDGTTAIFGPVLIVRPRAERELAAQLETATASEIGRSWVESARPPRMATKDGEALVMARAVYDVADPVDREAIASLEADAGSLEVHGSRIEISAMAESSLAEVEALVTAAAPSARLVDRSVIPLTPDVAARVRRRPGDRGEGLAEREEAEELVAAFIREREERWVDEPIPALGGRSAREACQDEAGPREVLRLLAGFGPAGRGAMDPDRLRARLGL